jgi:hypothetical protein
MKNRILFLTLFFSFNGISQLLNHNAQVSTGYNRVGFYNEMSYKLGLKQHYLKFGARHYTLDNFFVKNVVGFSFDYTKIIDANNKKMYFYPGVSMSFFVENKSHAKVVLNDYKVISGIGINCVKNLSVYYQIGFGILDVTSNLKMVDEIVKINYFNYEMVFGLSYRIGNSSK